MAGPGIPNTGAGAGRDTLRSAIGTANCNECGIRSGSFNILPTTTQLRRKCGLWKYFRPAVAHELNLANNNVLAWIRFPPDRGNGAMLSTEQINDLHRLYWSERWPIRKIERHLRMGPSFGDKRQFH